VVLMGSNAWLEGIFGQGEHPLGVEKICYYDQREFIGLFDSA